jgi:hypothetical protein
MRRKFKRSDSIKYSLAYVKVAEWIHDSEKYPKPTKQEFEDAKIHAQKIPDRYILKIIRENLEERTRTISYTDYELTPVGINTLEQYPLKHNEDTVENTKPLFEKTKEKTQPYSVTYEDYEDYRDEVDQQLEEFLKEIEEWEKKNARSK